MLLCEGSDFQKFRYTVTRFGVFFSVWLCLCVISSCCDAWLNQRFFCCQNHDERLIIKQRWWQRRIVYKWPGKVELISLLPRDTEQWCLQWRDQVPPPVIAWTGAPVRQEEASSRFHGIVLRTISHLTTLITATIDRDQLLLGLLGLGPFFRRMLCTWARVGMPALAGNSSGFPVAVVWGRRGSYWAWLSAGIWQHFGLSADLSRLFSPLFLCDSYISYEHLVQLARLLVSFTSKKDKLYTFWFLLNSSVQIIWVQF